MKDRSRRAVGAGAEAGLEERIRTLERRTIRRRALVLLLTLGWAGVALMGQKGLPPASQPLHEVTLVDGRGRIRATVGMAADSSACMQLRDAKQRTRARLCVSPQGEPRLEMLDTTGTALVALGSSASSPAFLRLSDGRHPGTEGIQLWLDEHGRPELDLVDARPECTARLRARVDDAPRIELHNWDSKVGGLMLYDRRQQLRAGLLLRASGTPAFSLLDAEGKSVHRVP